MVRTRRLDDVVAETGMPPTIIKIDVETHEPAVLAGARETLKQHRPYVVVEVLYRAKRDLGAPINDAFAGLGYSSQALDATPHWQAAERINEWKGIALYWLLAPEPLSEDFIERWRLWHERYLAFDLPANLRPPIFKSVRRAFGRGGSRENVSTAVRFFRRELIPSLFNSTKRRWNQLVHRFRPSD